MECYLESWLTSTFDTVNKRDFKNLLSELDYNFGEELSDSNLMKGINFNHWHMQSLQERNPPDRKMTKDLYQRCEQKREREKIVVNEISLIYTQISSLLPTFPFLFVTSRIEL